MTDGIGRASALLASGTLVSRLLGFVKTIVLVAAIGQFGVGANTFAIANGLPNAIYVIVAGGVLSAVLVPQIVRAGLNADGGAAYINKLVTVALVILAGTTVIAVIGAPVLVTIYGPQLSPEARDLAIAFALWCLPQIFFYGLYTVLGEVLNARKSFGPFTWSPALNNIVVIAGLGVIMAIYGADGGGDRPISEWTPGLIALLAGTSTLGIVLQAVVLFWFWRRIGLRYRPDFRWRGVGLRSAGRMASWTFGMLLLTTIAGAVSTAVLSSTAELDGVASVATIDYSWLIFMLPHSIITVSIATAYFTRMSEHASVNNLTNLRVDISSAVRGIGLVIVLAAAVLFVLAYPFAAVFNPGDHEGIMAFGNVIMFYILGLIAFSVLFVIQRAFYALGDTKTPFYFTLVQVVLFIIGALVVSGFPPQYLGVGIAGVTTLAGGVQLIVAFLLLQKRMHGIDAGRMIVSFSRYTIAVALPLMAGLAVLIAFGGWAPDSFALASRVSAIVTMCAVGLVMSVLYFAILWLMRAPELRVFATPLLARLRRR